MLNRHDLEFSLLIFKAVFFDKSIKQYFIKERPYLYTETEVYHMIVDQCPKYNHQQLKLHIKKYMERFQRQNTQDHCSDKEMTLDIFDVIFDFADTVITRYDNRFCFEYEYADIWRKLTREIDEEIFVTAAVLKNDLRCNIKSSRKMDWPFCIEHNNRDIKMMLQRDSGVSENHMHLRCASPYFYLSWIYLMNNLENSKFRNKIDEIEKSRLMKLHNDENDYPLELIWIKSASIRQMLYCYINIDNDCNLIGTLNDVVAFYHQNIEKFASDNLSILPITDLQKFNNNFRIQEGFDYAQNIVKEKNIIYSEISGERALLYNSLRIILETKEYHNRIKKILLLYLVMKNRFRSEIIQSNQRTGFFNFSAYEGRKDDFIWGDDVEKKLAKATICSIYDDMKYHRIELRISPKKTWRENADTIALYDEAIKDALKHKLGKRRFFNKKSFFYTLHFPKRDDDYSKGCCRHYKLRNESYQRAKALVEFRSYTNYETASRVLGIDACSHEINCRPEVFGPIFRYLQDFEPMLSVSNDKSLRQLKSTYHVGEDNYDILDALRAIYEAIYFLKLRSGSRLGHATLLGISPIDYYSINNPVSMPCQEFLDNIVWMYFFINEHDIISEDNAALNKYLEKQFNIYFNKIYSDDIQACFVNDVLKEAKMSPCLKFPIQRESFNRENCEFNIYHYYLSYLLRGDEPELYRKGYINEQCSYSEEYKICNTNSMMSKARENFEANYLYYLYHYSDRAKKRGKEAVREELPDFFIRTIRLVQEEMKKIISERGIGIETNPTSNVFISIIDDYSEHPIPNFYDYGLSKSKNEVQLNISINTDDKSTFTTCLSNEYAYLLYYLEHKKDKDNNTMYSRYEIMQWLDYIRKMGNDQSFEN